MYSFGDYCFLTTRLRVSTFLELTVDQRPFFGKQPLIFHYDDQTLFPSISWPYIMLSSFFTLVFSFFPSDG